MESRNFVQSLSRGLSLLSLLAKSSRPLTLTELSQKLGFSKGCIQRLTFTLLHLRYIERDRANKAFRLGREAFSIGFPDHRNMDLERLAYPYLEATSKEIEETLNLAVLDGKEIVYVGRVVSQQTLNISMQIGSRRPLHSTSMGKAILAFMAKGRLKELLDTLEMASFTSRTVTTRRELERDLDRITVRGFAVSNGEMEIGVRSVAAPIRNASGAVIAAVNIAVPAIRVSLRQLETVMAEKVTETADKISFVLGYRGKCLNRILNERIAKEAWNEHQRGQSAEGD
jgi:DNA-binding IclR family transcriptional regulator